MLSRVVYIHPNPMPSRQANTINVARMCDGLSEIIETRLVVRSASSGSRIKTHYGMSDRVEILAMHVSRWPIHQRLFGWTAFLAASRKSDLIYTRNRGICERALALGYQTIWELHEPITGRLAASTANERLLTSSNLRRIVAISEPVELSVAKVVQNESSVLRKTIIAPHGVVKSDEDLAVGGRGAFEPRVVYAGNLHAGRGLSIIKSLARDFPSVDFVIIGASREMYEAAGLGEPPMNFIFMGAVAPARISAMISATDILVAPYEREVFVGSRDRGHRTDAFMAPLKIFDYLGAQGVILASDLPAIRLILKNGVDALLLDPDQYSSWRDALGCVLGDKVLRSLLFKGAGETASRIGDWRYRASRILRGVI